MLDGVGWAALEIVVFMVAATLIGFAIGWVFVGWLQRASIAKEYEAELAAQQELAKKAEYRLAESNKSLDKVHLELKGESEKVGELDAQLKAAQADLAEIDASAVAAADGAAAAAADVAKAQADLATANSELAAAKDGRKAADADLARVKADLETCAAGRSDLEARVVDLETTVAVRESRIAELEAELSAALAVPEVVASPVAAMPEVADEDDGPTKEEGLARIAEIAERTAGGKAVADDDLKKVHGIGPKLERTLKSLGITSFRQIARFDRDDIVYVTAALDAFKGRIERDDWMGSAAAEHAKKYNDPI